jgi:penicillin G amidase
MKKSQSASRVAALALVAAACAGLAGCTALFLKKAWPQTQGTVGGLPVSAPVEIARDANGIVHITASTEHDAYVAQGFVHAQDRLWQMESIRRLTEGRLAEVAGEQAVAMDWLSRAVGLSDLRRRAFAGTSPAGREWLAAYAEGVNAYLRMRGTDLPLEFRSMGFVPEAWDAEDCLSILPTMAWGLAYPAYAEELFAVTRGGTFTQSEWNALFPVGPGVQPAPEGYFETVARWTLGKLNPAALVFHLAMPDRLSGAGLTKALLGFHGPGSGSNNWAVARGSGGAPILANDPHLGVSLPSTWYFCHITVPGKLNVAGTSLAGCPGVVIGRNEHVAWGMTNTMYDAVDFIVFPVDPADPTRYRTRGGWLSMEKQDVVIALPKGRSVTLPLYRTAQGPVLTAVGPGVQAAAALTWYGTLPEGALPDRTVDGLFTFMKARTVNELMEAGSLWACAGQNLLAVDDGGHLGWHAYGAVPVRDGWSGRLPADGSAVGGWTRFLPYDALPHSVDPAEGWLATANNSPAGWAGPALSHTWAPVYRHDRICRQVQAMEQPGLEEFRSLQLDVHSLQADRLLPKLLSQPWTRPEAAEAAAMLAAWDREVRPVSAAAALYEVFLDELVAGLVGDELGEDLALYLNAKAYGIEDEILDRPGSSLWDRRDTPQVETRAEVVEAALVRAMKTCAVRMGRNSSRWAWGKLHGYVFRHPGATNALFERLLNRGPFPAPGDDNTVNVSWCLPARGSYDATTIPSMRMIAALADPDGLWVAGPLGQSGQPGSPHYNDLTPGYLAGALVRVPLSADAARAVTHARLVLRP